MADPSHTDPGGGSMAEIENDDRPEIKNTSGLGGGIWIVLFGCVMVMALAANLLLSVLVVRNRKKHNLIYFIHLLLFAINLLDSSLLIFEFSLGIEQEYSYSQLSCTVYQVAHKGNPILQASAIIVMLIYAAIFYSAPRIHQNTPPSPHSSESANVTNIQDNKLTSHHRCYVTENLTEIQVHGVRRLNSRTNDFILFGVVVVVLVIIEFILSIPTALFASIVNVKDRRYCEIDLSSSSFLYTNNYDDEEVARQGYFYDSNKVHQMVLSVYYLIYSSILTFWFPLAVSIIPALRLMRNSNRDKYPEISVVLGTVSSFFLFYIFHATLVFVRNFYGLCGHEFSAYNIWMIKVGQSSLLLIAYFWHFIRPALALSLDLDLKEDLSRLLRLDGYGSLAGVGTTTELQPLSNVYPPATIVFENQDLDNRTVSTGKWNIVSRMKYVFTRNLLVKNNTATSLNDKKSFLIVPHTEIDIPIIKKQCCSPLVPTSESKTDMKSIDEEISSALTQNIGENTC